MIDRSHTRSALAMSVFVHGALALAGWWAIDPDQRTEVELVDIEVAPPPPAVEALPAEVARRRGDEHPQQTEDRARDLPAPGDGLPDAGIDAAVDAPPDARPKRRDAATDAEPSIAVVDGGVDDANAGDATQVADDPSGDAGQLTADDAGADATQVAAGEHAPAGAPGTGSNADGSNGSGAIASATTEPAVEGAPTTAGTAANLLAYFPDGHVTTALIRFDRLRGTEWAAQTERLFRPMPDYRLLFGPADAQIADKLDTIIISTPQPRDATATTLVGRTSLQRGPLRAFLSAVVPVSWSASKGGLLGRRSGNLPRGDKRVFLSPFGGWFLLAQPADLGALVAPAPGRLDAVEATGKLPPWLGGIRAIEAESGGDQRGPALVLTLALSGKRVELGDNDFGLGVKRFPMPDRVSLAAELVKQGWLARGNLRFASAAAAEEFVTAAEAVKQRIADSRILQVALGKPAARVVANLSFARSGPRVSYATSISIADMRAIMSVAAQQLDSYFASRP